ncbi:uncharacterized protein VTP21DRAFT_814 [Calcarisporiella thermophila]|uniref:uncharacterized protein n=1 Tax=Calcarisporiella thermophila TaxID=911321 RepID=UPI0037441290
MIGAMANTRNTVSPNTTLPMTAVANAITTNKQPPRAHHAHYVSNNEKLINGNGTPKLATLHTEPSPGMDEVHIEKMNGETTPPLHTLDFAYINEVESLHPKISSPRLGAEGGTPKRKDSEPAAPITPASVSPVAKPLKAPAGVSRSATYVAPSSRISRSNTSAGEAAAPRHLHRRNTYNPDDDLHRKVNPDWDDLRQLQEELARRKARRLSKLLQRKQQAEDEVLVGTRIGEDHVNYVLMYNMLTGIRISVSRCTAKPMRVLNNEDFSAAHKMTFDIKGNELTPSVKYDFKFKDYAPWVFRHLRELFGIHPADYLVALTNKYVLSELSSAGKSGAFFYYSQDYRFIIKTIHHSEHKWMRKILKQYYEHVKENPNTLLCRYYGLHRVKLPHGRKIHFVVMQNVFPANKDIHETYDLKGSTFGRELPEAECRENPRAVMKDLNWLARKKCLELGPEKRRVFVGQLERDVRLLQNLNIMDYSLLIGVHDRMRGNRDNLREKNLWLFEPTDGPSPSSPHQQQPQHKKEERRLQRTPTNAQNSTASALRRAVVASDPVRVTHEQLPLAAAPERARCCFYADEGGFMSTDERNLPGRELYYLGIIDILTPFNLTKRAECFWKGLRQDRKGISAVPPVEYGGRFLKFMKETIRHRD